ncbi:MAG: hypothetical protein HY735_08565 [Verrucomicrobia bacterium]|nr:hypothetical protein [Verrucomicrobiota bacterium]
MKPSSHSKSVLIVCGLIGLGPLTSVRGADTTIDFNADPQAAGTYRELGNGAAEWRKDGGSSGKAADGYLAITDARGGQQSTLVFKDLDPGKVIKAFKFEADLRIGGGTDRPADGFSLNFVRIGDPLLTHADEGTDPAYLDFAGTDNEAHLPEEGSATGLGIGFDTWQSAAIKGVPDVVGISVRVDGELITQFPVPLKPGNLYPGGEYNEVPYRNLATTDANYKSSMQTGKRNTDDGFDPNPAQPAFVDDPATWALNIKHLVWEKFIAEITEDAKLKIFWKGVELTPAGGLQTKFFPSGGRIVLAGRTGGAWEVHHIDNIKLTTVAATDSAPPTAPSGLKVSSTTPRKVVIGWTASTDDSGKVAYNIERDGTSIATFRVDTTYTDRAVAPGKTYSYKVVAVDAAGNKSAASAAVSATTPQEVLVETKGYLKFEAWGGITGTPVDNLLNDARYPATPDFISLVSSFNTRTAYADDSHENYGGKMSGWITPTETADYNFFLRSDDASQLFISSDDKAANLSMVAEETGCCGAFEEPGAPETTGAPIRLTAGRKYYVEAIWKEGGGGDYMQVAWRKANDNTPAAQLSAIPGQFLSTMYDTKIGPPVITKQPQGQEVTGGTASIKIEAGIGEQPVTYQWRFAGKDIAGATADTLAVSDFGFAKIGGYSVVVNNADGTAASQNAFLLPKGTLFIEAEDFNYGGGKYVTDKPTGLSGTYPGGSYRDLGTDADAGIDWNAPGGNAGQPYRPGTGVAAGKPNQHTDGIPRGSFDVQINHVVGWNDGGDWYNYTRVFPTPALDYNIVGRLSSGGNPINGQFDQITAGVKTANQTLKKVGVFKPGRATAGWDIMEWFPLTDDAGKAVSVNIGGEYSFRFTTLPDANLDVDYFMFVPVSAAAPPSGRTYGIGLNFGANEANGNVAADAAAGVAGVAQANWNALRGQNGTNTTIVADAGGASQPTTVRVQWTSNGTWASTGRGEENIRLPAGPDKTLMTGYLDTGNATTTSVTISGLPSQLTSGGYDVYVYALGGVSGRGGGYRVLDANTKAVLKDYVRAQSGANPTEYVKVPVPPPTGTHGVGNYIVFSGLNAANITIEATTAGGFAFGSTPRAPVNAVQLVAPASSAPPIKILAERTAAGLKLTFTGTLQSADSVAGPWTDVAGATSPRDIPFSGAGKFYRSKQ